jgi:osmotically-inducible protein OsmY
MPQFEQWPLASRYQCQEEIMKTNDFQLRHDVEAELDWDSRLDSRQIGVAVKEGVVALSGHVSSYPERRAAEEAVLSVAGVRAVANDIVVELPSDTHRTDAEIGEAAVKALQMNVGVPPSSIKITVRDGWITIDGEVAVWYQRKAAETALASLPGIKGISNNVVMNAPACVSDVKGKIEEAFRRRALLDARNIVVKAVEGVVTLEGEVFSWQERQQAEVAAWQAPGVCEVIDRLVVRPRGLSETPVSQ